MAAHPLLMDNSVPTAQTKKEKYRPMTPMFSTTKVRIQADLLYLTSNFVLTLSHNYLSFYSFLCTG